jgi:hypothetical protein
VALGRCDEVFCGIQWLETANRYFIAIVIRTDHFAFDFIVTNPAIEPVSVFCDAEVGSSAAFVCG